VLESRKLRRELVSDSQTANVVERPNPEKSPPNNRTLRDRTKEPSIFGVGPIVT
jgi:hypothetical protein